MYRKEENKKVILLNNIGYGAQEYLRKIKPDIQTMAYIPSRSDFGKVYYKRVTETYAELVKNFIYCDLEKNNSEKIMKLIFSSDAIFLAGGDECFILKTMLTNRMKDKFENYLKKGGLIIGLCAGAEVLSQDIILVEESKKKGKIISLDYGLQLIDFVVFPRYDSMVNKNSVIEYCKKTNKKIILMGQNSCVVLDGEKMSKEGDVEII